MYKNLTREMQNHPKDFNSYQLRVVLSFGKIQKLSLGVLSPTILKQRMLPH